MWIYSISLNKCLQRERDGGVVTPQRYLRFVQPQLNKPKSCFLLILPNKPHLFCFVLIVLLWTLTINIHRCNSWGLCIFSEQCMVWPWGKFAGTFTPGKIDNCLECFVNNLSQCRMMDFKLLIIIWKWPYNPSRLMMASNCFSKPIADVFPPWRLNALNKLPRALLL